MDAASFTDGSRSLLHAAGDEAAARRHEYVGTEHILLAMLHSAPSGLPPFLTTVGADPDVMAAQLIGIIKPGSASLPSTAQRPYTSRVMKVLKLALAAARDDRSPVGPKHLLAGLLREKKGIAAQVLAQAGVTDEQVTRWLSSTTSR